VMIHYEEALYQVYAPLPLPLWLLKQKQKSFRCTYRRARVSLTLLLHAVTVSF